MLDLINSTPLTVQLFPSTDKFGEDSAVVVVKASFDFQGDGSRLNFSKTQMPICKAAQYYGEPDDSSIKYETDLSPVKNACDIVLVGDAVAQEEQPVQALDVKLSVAEHHFTMRVFGNRVWESTRSGWYSSAPEYFTRMPLKYENAYGGYSKSLSDIARANAINPLGKGHLRGSKDKYIEGEELPNIENPRSLIKSPQDQPQPWCCAFSSPAWASRSQYAGTYDRHWQTERMPLLPMDFDTNYHNAAHPQLQIPFLTGGEFVQLENLSPAGVMGFHLPKAAPSISFTIKGKRQDRSAQLDTVVIEPSSAKVHITWRAVMPCRRQFLYLNSVEVSLRKWS